MHPFSAGLMQELFVTAVSWLGNERTWVWWYSNASFLIFSTAVEKVKKTSGTTQLAFPK